MILVLGSNPSNKSIDNTPFSLSTKSGRLIRGWFYAFEEHILYNNISDKPTPNNRPLSKLEIKLCIPRLQNILLSADAIVTVGKAASEAVSISGFTGPVFHLPHPSGRCRIWNDKSQQAKYLLALNEFLNSVITPSDQQL